MARTPLVAPGSELDDAERRRYSRQIRLPQIGVEGQRRLKAARVLVIGAGGLGSPVLTYLAAAGVGTLGIVDFDTVDVSNLQRQTIHTVAAVGELKTRSAEAGIRSLNPHVTVQLHDERLTGRTAARILSGYDLVVDATDNFAARYLANDTAALLRMPYIWGSVLRFDGQVSTFWPLAPGGAVDLRHLFPTPPADDEAESCAVAGVLGPLCGVVGSAMAAEALKLIVGFGEPLFGRILVVDALDSTFTIVPFRAAAESNPPLSDTAESRPTTDSTATSDGSSPMTPDTARATAAPATAPAASSVPRRSPSVTVDMLAERLAARAAGTDDFVLVDVREEWEHDAVAIEGAELVPLDSLLSDAARALIPQTAEVLVHCHHDGRSRYARDVLLQSGYSDVTFVEGGIDAWAALIDPTLPRY
ncbi:MULTISPECIES: molybdopterin-synthase adenylyltransferase MoeB [Subtercola]|uniref:Molybdopterin-synthase adenylyltransferase MoeB n=1 Tax=Subtercola vilae TaxID=2056433 RepID=A0A4T2C1Q2_9MICO|nr:MULTISPECIES: molybdopterin-synthase adenylyltransferase MoeB [Subtercola]MEA9985700.1 molybdopterin-synthase adenylyltransferase MoeB [Subtercola sp. RTI3]TIH38243.1 molybdopterin-synthase adenylyltransferase MoeB [Subtercola vilae]